MALALVATIVALVLAEALVRALGLAAPGGVATVSQSDYARIPGIYAPNQHVRSGENAALPFSVTTDSLGYRSTRRDPWAHDEIRVLFTGDSFTFGSFVDDSVTVPALVEEILRSDCPRVRVLNAGLTGSTITDQRTLVSRGLTQAPRMVVLMFSENDLSDLAATPMWQRLAENREQKSRFPMSVAYPVLRKLALWNVVLMARARLAWQFPPQARLPPQRSTADGEGLRVTYAEELAALKRELDSAGVDLVVAAMPSHFTVSGERDDGVIRWFHAIAASEGLVVADLLSALRATTRPTDELYLLPEDGHTAPPGNHAAAAAIAAAISPGLPCGRQ